VVPGVTVDVHAERGAGLGGAEVEGDDRVFARRPDCAGLVGGAAGLGGAGDAVGEFRAVGVAGIPGGLAGDGGGVGFADGEVFAEGLPLADELFATDVFAVGVAVGEGAAGAFGVDREGFDDGLVFAADVDRVGGGPGFDEVGVGALD